MSAAASTSPTARPCTGCQFIRACMTFLRLSSAMSAARFRCVPPPIANRARAAFSLMSQFSRFGIVCTIALSQSSCAWRTSRADHVFGPALYRFSPPSHQKPAVVQTLHLPFLLEGGRQWGVSVGGIQRLALAPRRSNGAAGSEKSEAQPQGCWISSEPGNWHMSWLYLRAPLREPPVFIRRSVVGLHAGGGAEERGLSLGYSSVTATTPREAALYELDFDSRHPLDATFVVTPVATAEQLNPQLQKEPP